MAAIGERAARRYFLTAERFGADEALRIGLVHQVVPADQLDSAVDTILTGCRRAVLPQRAAKDLISPSLTGPSMPTLSTTPPNGSPPSAPLPKGARGWRGSLKNASRPGQ